MKHSVWREWAVILLLLWLAIAAGARWDWFARVDRSAYDLAMRLWQRPALPDIVVVGVDDASLQQIGRWPWNRAVHATLVQKLAEAKPAVIALDFILTEPDRKDPQADLVLARVIQRAGNVVVPIIPRIDEGRIVGDLAPVQRIADAAASLAQIHAQADPDGVLRRLYLMGGAGDPAFRLLGYESLVLSGKYANRVKTAAGIVSGPAPVPHVDGGAWRRSAEFLVPFAGPPGHFTEVSYVSVLRGDIPPPFFKNKIVLVGVTASGLGDELPTPTGGDSRAMPGIEIHANVVQALAQGIELEEASSTMSAIIAMGAVLLVMLGYLKLTPGRSLLLAIAMLLNLALATVLSFRYGMLWISPSLAIFAVATTYPLWSWRKLSATQRYFDAELARLAAEPDLLPASQQASQGTQSASDFMEGRIIAITAATARLRNLKRFVADALENLPTAALVVDLKGQVLLSNSRADALFTIPEHAAALEGRQLLDALTVLTPEQGAWRDFVPRYTSDAASATQLQSPDATPVTVEAKAHLGNIERDCAVQFAPLFTNTSEIAGLIVTIADVTQLKESERRRDEVLRFLSHDMRSPQASIITLLEMVREDPDRLPQATILDRIGKYSRRTLTLADDFLRMARAERAKASEFVPIELTEILQDVVDEGTDAARGRSTKVVLDAEADEAWVKGDRDLLTRAVINLLSNAIKYSSEQTTVTVRLTAIEDPLRWKIDVTDEGFGIAPENMSKLFQRFQRIDQEGQPRTDGIGLGLVFVKTVVERMGGHVEVASQVVVNEGDAHGTTFSIVLPAVHLEDGED